MAVDMETSAIAAVCEAKGVSWSVFRSISDHVGDAIVDEAVLGMMRPDGASIPGRWFASWRRGRARSDG